MQIRSLCISLLMDRTRWYEILNSEHRSFDTVKKKKTNEIIWPTSHIWVIGLLLSYIEMF